MSCVLFKVMLPVITLAGLLVCLHLARKYERARREALDARDEILRVYRERLRELQSIREELAHGLKNPLASIKGLVGLMVLEPLRAPERLDMLQKEVCRLQTVIEEYLSFARPLTPLTAETVCLKTTVVDIATVYQAFAASRKVSLDLSAVETVELVGDRQKLKQMLVSLIVNAIEASKEGDQVELICRRQGECVRLAVLDCGPGVPVDLLPRLGTPGLSTKERGTGLGLTVVRALAEQHGGSLVLRNRDGGGFVAEIELPLQCSAHSVQQLA